MKKLMKLGSLDHTIGHSAILDLADGAGDKRSYVLDIDRLSVEGGEWRRRRTWREGWLWGH